jgi:GT2 family glycosyltransferase
MADLPLVYVLTLNWNRCADTVDCLQALTALTYEPKRLLLVDNGSTDDTVTTVRHMFPQVDVLETGENLGFGGGFNAGMAYALAQGADYVFIINNDAFPAADAIEQLLAVMAADVGIAAPKIYYADDPRRIWSVGGLCHRWTIEKTGDARGELDDQGAWNEVLERDYFTGCALLFPRAFLIDERFFMYYEDSDLSRRAAAGQFRQLLAPRAHVWHKVSVSSGGSDSPNERYWMARSSVLFFARHVRGWRWLVVGPYRLGSALKTSARLLVQGRRAALRAYWAGLRDGLADARKVAD